MILTMLTTMSTVEMPRAIFQEQVRDRHRDHPRKLLHTPGRSARLGLPNANSLRNDVAA